MDIKIQSMLSVERVATALVALLFAAWEHSSNYWGPHQIRMMQNEARGEGSQLIREEKASQGAVFHKLKYSGG